MTEQDHVEEVDGPSARVAAAAILDAIEALESERPDLAAQLRGLLDRLEEAPAR
jgi:hypothetical protein